jgi:hypothetical protein
MKCIVNDFLSCSALDKVQELLELVKTFKDKIVKIIELGKDDKNLSQLKNNYKELYNGKIEQINKLYKEKINLINKNNENLSYNVVDSVDRKTKNYIHIEENNLKYDKTNKITLKNIIKKKGEYKKDNGCSNVSNNIMKVINQIINNSKEN